MNWGVQINFCAPLFLFDKLIVLPLIILFLTYIFQYLYLQVIKLLN